LALAPASALAHDYWLAPERFSLPVGEVLRVDLRLGGHFEAEESKPYQAARTKRFELVTPDGTVDLRERAKEGATPVLEGLVPEHEGPGLLAMERRWIDIELTDAKFTDYLEHEGLTAITKLRKQQGHREVERECYMRSLKSLVRVGEGKDDTGLYRRVLGHRIEIVLLDDPYALDPGDELRARVLWKGKPLPDALVTAHHRPAPEKGKVGTLTARTDAEGEVSFRLVAGGAWLLRLVHMVPCRGCSYTDWESYWTSFSFEVD
jgi:uncharacterized GH25 family protein